MHRATTMVSETEDGLAVMRRSADGRRLVVVDLIDDCQVRVRQLELAASGWVVAQDATLEGYVATRADLDELVELTRTAAVLGSPLPRPAALPRDESLTVPPPRREAA